MSGLVLLTLPIGNNKDLTFRAKEVLESAEFVLAEDTRVFKDFCKHNHISLDNKKIDSFHDHTDENKLNKVLETLQNHEVVMVSDAGSPVISDPAYPLIQAVLNNGIELQSVPGVNSVVTALELSGLPPVPFQFHAFIPRDKGKKEKFADHILSSYGTHIFFEGVSRVKETMKLLSQSLPELDFCIARELTKEFQSVYRFKGNAWKDVEEQIVYKGEFVILVHNPNQTGAAIDNNLKQLAQEILDGGVHPKKLSKLIAKILNLSPKETYQKIQK